MKELKDKKNEFEVNHASRMANLKKAIESSRETQKAKPSETKNSQKIKAMADLLASL